MSRRHAAVTMLIALLALPAGCADEGPYPSLAPRPAERDLADADALPPAPPLPDDPRVAEQVRALVGEARRGQAEFEAALPTASAAAARAGASGSDSWVEAQQALSRVEAARTTTVRALAELDRLTFAEAEKRALSAADLDRLTAATAAVQSIADRQHETLARLQASLSAL
jgi:hypothetical protein